MEYWEFKIVFKIALKNQIISAISHKRYIKHVEEGK